MLRFKGGPPDLLLRKESDYITINSDVRLIHTDGVFGGEMAWIAPGHHVTIVPLMQLSVKPISHISNSKLLFSFTVVLLYHHTLADMTDRYRNSGRLSFRCLISLQLTTLFKSDFLES